MQSNSHGQVAVFGNAIPAARVRKAQTMLRRYRRKYGFREDDQYPLVAEDNGILGPLLGVKNVISRASGNPLDPKQGIIIGTVRMGYGHYRIAMAIASAAHSMGLIPYWFDFWAFDWPGARMLRDIEYWYSFGSKISQKSRLFNRLVWEPLMSKAYRRAEKNYPIMETCRLFASVCKGFPEDMPFVGTYPWTVLAALHAGMTRVVNTVPDNMPQGFCLCEGAMHAVQSPSSYFGFRAMKDMGNKSEVPKGVPASHLAMTGHYVDHELVANIENDCGIRLERMAKKMPRRLLISVGGARAQQQLLLDLVSHLLPYVRDGRVVLFVNLGDHKHFLDVFRKGIKEFDQLIQMHSDWNETVRFAQSALSAEPRGFHVFLHEDSFASVYTTNLLIRCSDILLTKPSELAFYPIPKLILQRVGGHEAWGAIRAAELGDGTMECQDLMLACQALDLMVQDDDLLELHCDQIVKMNQTCVYSGAYKVVELALEHRLKPQ